MGLLVFMAMTVGKWMRNFHRLALGCVALSSASCCYLHVADVWCRDPRSPLPPTQVGRNDASRLYANEAEVIRVPHDPDQATGVISATIRRASREHRIVSVSGARHSMGGHTFTPGGLVLDILDLNGLQLDESRNLLHVGAGARWSEVIPYLDRRGRSVKVMQASNDFSVGGSLSVNCHGWQHNSPPIASSVEGFTLITADGRVRHCSRQENRELFSLALGGYGLFGVIIDADLRVVPNEFYQARSERVRSSGYLSAYRRLTAGKAAGMAYGRINPSPSLFLDDSIVTVLERCGDDRATGHTLHPSTSSEAALLRVKRSVFRSGLGHPDNKELRWQLELSVGETGKKPLSRNQIMNESSDWFANRDPSRTDLLHEIFVPVKRLDDFLVRARTIMPQHPQIDLLNVTVRNVEPDHDTFLRYAREEVFGVVMLFDLHRDMKSDQEMAALTRQLTDAALALGGTYYLPYRPHATQRQFEQAYPQAKRFAALKRHYDPQGLFDNEFWQRYGKPLE